VDDDLTVCVTAEVSMLHTRECPHLGGDALAGLLPASVEQIEALPMCSSCRKVLDGGRRQVFATLDQAMEAYRTPLENRQRVREIAAQLAYGIVWIPASRSYIGVAAAPGSSALAYFGKGYADLHRETGGYDREWLPRNGGGGARVGSASLDAALPKICPTCFTALPGTGICDTCDT
jgi:hypothetical protein